MKKISKTAKTKVIVSVIFILAVVLTIFFLIYPSTKVSDYNQYLASLKQQKESQGMQSLKERNSDFVAWLDCKDLDVSIPIVMSSSSDKDFYLTHNFDKESNELGSPYHYNTSTLGTSSNTTIIGHSAYVTTTVSSNSTNSTFQSIMGNFNNYVNGTNSTNFDYKIIIETMSQTLTYQVFSAFSYDTEQDCTAQNQLFYTTNLTTEQDFNNYITSATNLSQKNFRQTATFGDKFITIYTCSYETNHRIIIIAKQIMD